MAAPANPSGKCVRNRRLFSMAPTILRQLSRRAAFATDRLSSRDASATHFYDSAASRPVATHASPGRNPEETVTTACDTDQLSVYRGLQTKRERDARQGCELVRGCLRAAPPCSAPSEPLSLVFRRAPRRKHDDHA